jgi:hypothetical protein
MTRLLAVVFSTILFTIVLAHEASARRGGGIHVGGGGLRVGGGGLRGFSAGGLRAGSIGGYRGGLRVGNIRGYRAAAWGGRRYWGGPRRWYGYGAGIAALAGAYAYSSPYYGYAYSPYYGYSGYPYYRRSAYYNYPAYGYSAYYPTYGYTSSMGGTTASAAVQQSEGPGTCGTYRYWKDGRCLDARAK